MKGLTPPNDITLAPYPLPYKISVFLLTFSSYVAMKAANKSFSLVQPILVRQEFFTSPIYQETSSGQTQMIGMISTLFLAFYATGQFFVGTLADQFDLRYFLSIAMVCAGILTLIFSLAGYLEYHQLWVYCIIWSLNGIAQACGWPSNLTIMNNWFGKKSRGLIFSAWSSNANLGNILGAVICGVIFAWYPNESSVWQLCMLVCGLGSIIGAIPIFLFLVPKPLSSSNDSRTSSDDETTADNSFASPVPAPTPTGALSSSRVQRGVPKYTSIIFPLEKEKKEKTKIAQSSPKVLDETFIERGESDGREGNTVENTQIIPIPVEGLGVYPSSSISLAVTSVALPAPAAPSTRSSYFATLSLGLCTRGVIPYMIIYGCIKGVVYVFMYWMPLFLTSSKGMSTSTAAIVSSLFDIGGFIGGVSSGHVTDLIGSRTIVIIVMTFLSLLITWLLFSSVVQQVWVIALCLLGLGISIGGSQVLISASVALDLGDTATEKKDDDHAGEREREISEHHQETTSQDIESSPSSAHLPSPSPSPSSSSSLSGTVSGLIEGSGSAGAAVLQYLVGELIYCDDDRDDDDGANVKCTWSSILIVITASISLSLLCLLYIKFSKRLDKMWR